MDIIHHSTTPHENRITEGMSSPPNQPDMIYDSPLPPSPCSHRSLPRLKIPYSYSSLITLAIRSSPEGRLTLREIYNWLSSEYPDRFVTGDGACLGWQNTVRHNLSVNKVFVKISRIIEEQHETIHGMMNLATRGRGDWWTLRHNQEEAQLRLLSGGLKREEARQLHHTARGRSDVNTLSSQHHPVHSSSLGAYYSVPVHHSGAAYWKGGWEETPYYPVATWKQGQQVSLDDKSVKKEESEQLLNHSPTRVYHPYMMTPQRQFPSRLSEPAFKRTFSYLDSNLEVGYNVSWDKEETSRAQELQENVLKQPGYISSQLWEVTNNRQEVATWRRHDIAHKDEARPESRVSIRNLLNP